MLLTAEQHDAANIGIVGAGSVVLCSAGPGTGKTVVLAHRIGLLIDAGERPGDILALTFTRSAATSIRLRVAYVIGPALAEAVTIETFHSFAARTAVPPGMRVASDMEADAALQSLYAGPHRLPSTPLGIQAMRRAIVKREASGDPGPEDVILRRLEAVGLMPCWALLSRYRIDRRFRHVLVDEYQDCTPAERLLARQFWAGQSLFLVGDERQAIMGWRGAAGFCTEDTTHDCSLTETFRFGPFLADVANLIAALGSPDTPCISGATGVDTNFRKRGDPESAIMGLDPASTAILVRTNREADILALDLGGRARVIRRDPSDPFGADADGIASAWQDCKFVISTIHGFKGREADHVVLARDLEARYADPEEYRVTYVGLTRARESLTIIPEIVA